MVTPFGKALLERLGSTSAGRLNANLGWIGLNNSWQLIDAQLREFNLSAGVVDIDPY
jgi:hypothetical protein